MRYSVVSLLMLVAALAVLPAVAVIDDTEPQQDAAPRVSYVRPSYERPVVGNVAALNIERPAWTADGIVLTIALHPEAQVLILDGANPWSGSCDDCVKAGNDFCKLLGKGNAKNVKTVSAGKECKGECTNGGAWQIVCRQEPSLQGIIDECDPTSKTIDGKCKPPAPVPLTQR